MAKVGTQGTREWGTKEFSASDVFPCPHSRAPCRRWQHDSATMILQASGGDGTRLFRTPQGELQNHGDRIICRQALREISHGEFSGSRSPTLGHRDRLFDAQEPFGSGERDRCDRGKLGSKTCLRASCWPTGRGCGPKRPTTSWKSESLRRQASDRSIVRCATPLCRANGLSSCKARVPPRRWCQP